MGFKNKSYFSNRKFVLVTRSLNDHGMTTAIGDLHVALQQLRVTDSTRHHRRHRRILQDERRHPRQRRRQRRNRSVFGGRVGWTAATWLTPFESRGTRTIYYYDLCIIIINCVCNQTNSEVPGDGGGDENYGH